MIIFIILSVSGILSMLAGTHNKRDWGLPLVLSGATAALVCIALQWLGDFDQWMHQMLIFDEVSIAFSLSMIVLTIIILLSSYFYYNPPVQHVTDIYALLMFSLAGAFLLVSANNLVVVFLGAEILSIPLYILAASHRRSLLSNEAGLKYYLMGSFATCFLLLGITLMYGASGTFDISELGTFIKNGGFNSSLFLTGFTLLLGTLLFKLSAVPFHFWAPDVYEGSPSILTAFVSTVVKVAIVGVLFRLIYTFFDRMQVAGIQNSMPIIFKDSVWYIMLYLASAASMIFGSIVAIRQSDIKRLLAYTGIHNAGFILIPVLTGNGKQTPEVLYYLTSYGIAAILCLILYAEIKKQGNLPDISGLRGLFFKNKAAGLTLVIAMLSFSGIPPLAGFWGKINIISIGLEGSILPLIIVAIITTVISAYNYIRIAFLLIDNSTMEPSFQISMQPKFYAFLFLLSFLLIGMGLLPEIVTFAFK